MAFVQSDLEEKTASFRSAKKDLYPTLSFQYSYTNQPDDITTENYYNYAIVLEQPLYQGKALITAKELRNLDIEYSHHFYRKTRNDLIFQTYQAYYGLLRALKLEDVAQQAVQSLEAHVHDAQAFYDAGLIPKNDLLQSEVEFAQGQQDFLKAQNDSEISRSNLNLLMRRPIDASLAIKDIMNYLPNTIKWAEIFDLAMANRAEILQQEILVQQAEQNVKLVRAPFLPSVSLTAKYLKQGDDPLAEDYPSPYPFSPSNEIKTVQALAQWKFWSWGKSSDETFAANRRVAKAKDSLAGVVDQITLELREAFIQLKQAEKNIFVAEKAVEQAQENFRISQARYKAQLSTSTEVLDAQTLLSRAQSNHYNTLYLYNIALVALDKATGVLEQKYSQ